MKKKHWLIGLAAVLLTVFAAKGIGWYHWSKLSAEEKAGKVTEKMSRRFDLTAAQKDKVYALNLAKVQAFESARAAGHRDRSTWKNLHSEWKAGMNEILTPEQQQKFRH